MIQSTCNLYVGFIGWSGSCCAEAEIEIQMDRTNERVMEQNMSRRTYIYAHICKDSKAKKIMHKLTSK